MGTWGGGIFDDDEAQDAQDAYREILSQGVDGTKATDRFLKEWKSEMKDSDDGPVIWFALAETQWRLGRLEDRVRDAAIRLIDDGSSLDRWREAGEKPFAKRQKALLALKEKLLSPQPALKKIKVQKPLKPVPAGKPLKPAEVRDQLRALHCSLEPARGGALTSVICRAGMTDQLLSALEACADTLEELHIAASKEVTEVGLQSIGRFLRLKRLIVRDLPIKDANLSHWKNLKELERLEIHGRHISDAGMEHFSACSKLKAIELGRTSVGDKTAAWIGQLAGVREVWLRDTKITDRGLASLKDQLGIRQLYLAKTGITDRGLQHIAGMSNLLWLDIADTEVTDRGATSLAACKSIRGLDVEGTGLTDKCLPALLKMKDLCYLNVERTKITKAGQRQLTEGLSELGNRDAMDRLRQSMV